MDDQTPNGLGAAGWLVIIVLVSLLLWLGAGALVASMIGF